MQSLRTERSDAQSLQPNPGHLASAPVCLLRRGGALCTALLCIVMSAQALAVQAPADRFDQEPITERAGKSQPRRPAPAGGAAQVERSAAATATIHGSVFYNDRRTDGLFASRRDKDGNPGKRCNGDGKRYDGTACSLNWLAGKYMVVDVIERDEGFLPTDFNCKQEDVLTSVAVAYDGSFTATIPTADPCNHDKLSNAAIVLRVRLRFCGSSYCFSINDTRNHPYAVVHPDASTSNPLTVKAGDDITMRTLNFSTASDPAQPNNYSIAANYYASIVDAILALHKDSTVPFYQEEFGEIQYLFPSTDSDTATTRSPATVAISTFQSQPDDLNGKFAWVDGKTPAHEYGHVLMLRAWDGSYGFDGIGISANDTEKAPSQQIAFKEAWAEFIARAVFQPTRGCDDPDYDKNGSRTSCSPIRQSLDKLRADRREQVKVMEFLQGPGLEHAQEQLDRIDSQIAQQEAALAQCQTTYTTTDLPGALGEGAQWRSNVTKALCDWYDSADDDDANTAGAGDHFAAEDLYSMWYNLRRMYVDADKYGGEFKNPGLWFCDYVSYYLDVRKSASAAGAASHASYESTIRDLIYNNNIGCSMSAPQ